MANIKLNLRKFRLLRNRRSRHFFFIVAGKFIKRGKKNIAYKHLYKCLVRLKLKERFDINMMLQLMIERLRPVLDVQSKFSSGINYLLPTHISEKRARSLALIWLYKGVVYYTERQLHKRMYWEFKLLMDGGSPRCLDFKRDHYKLIRRNKILLYRFKRKLKI